jgi:hypothetical protein
MTTAKKLFGPAHLYLPMIDAILPAALNHEYKFISDEWFAAFMNSDEPIRTKIGLFNHIVASELLDKSHLAAVTALLRAKRWADAVCLMYEANNFVGWAGAARGLLESAGDTVDGLLNIPSSLAQSHGVIAQCIVGKEDDLCGFSQLEDQLDHFVHGRWIRTKRGEKNKLKAKDNVDYVRILESVIPSAEKLYHRLCSVTHPSKESLDYFYEPALGKDGSFKLSAANDAKALSEILSAYPTALCDVLMMSCNPPLLTLRVLHKFGIHPKLTELKRFDFSSIKMWPDIERLLKSSGLAYDRIELEDELKTTGNVQL